MHPSWVNSGMSPEQVWAPESASMDAVAVRVRKLGGNGRSVGMTERSVMTSIVIVSRGGSFGACLTNFSPSHSMCGTAILSDEPDGRSS